MSHIGRERDGNNSKVPRIQFGKKERKRTIVKYEIFSLRIHISTLSLSLSPTFSFLSLTASY